MVLLAASTAPVIFGWYGEEFECLIFHLVHNSTIILLLKFCALLIIIFPEDYIDKSSPFLQTSSLPSVLRGHMN